MYHIHYHKHLNTGFKWLLPPNGAMFLTEMTDAWTESGTWKKSFQYFVPDGKAAFREWQGCVKSTKSLSGRALIAQITDKLNIKVNGKRDHPRWSSG